MNIRPFVLLVIVAVAGCGEKVQEARNTMNAVEEVTKAASKVEESKDEAAKFQAERRSKGDTVAMPYAELQKYLPAPPSGYAPKEEPSGSSQNMTGFSMSQAEQTFVKPAGADGSAPSFHVTIVDFGGTEMAYGLMALPMMMNISREDAHQRMTTLTMETPHTWASEDFNKDNKNAKVTAVTRYRYMITVEARDQADDQTAMAKAMVEEIAKKFEGK